MQSGGRRIPTNLLILRSLLVVAEMGGLMTSLWKTVNYTYVAE